MSKKYSTLFGGMLHPRFRSRAEAGRLLADRLAKHEGQSVVVYALPRGGVVLGVEVARALRAPLEVLSVRKVGHPTSPEYAVCAVTDDGHVLCNAAEVETLDRQWLEAVLQREQAEAWRQQMVYQPKPITDSAEGKVAIITDDGVATGLTAAVAVQAVRDRQPAKIVLAAPVLPADVAQSLRGSVDELVTLDIPEVFLGSVGAYYDEFEQLSDEEVLQLLATASAAAPTR